VVLIGIAIFIAAMGVLAGRVAAATPNSGSVSQSSTTTSWQGTSFTVFAPAGDCASGTPNCETYDLTVAPGDYTNWDLTFSLTASSGADDYGMYVTDPSGTQTSNEATNPALTLNNPAPGVYHVEVYAFTGAPNDSYVGSVTLTQNTCVPGTYGSDDVRYSCDPAAARVKVDATLRVVMVGFKPGELDQAKILGQVPKTQRPGVLIPYSGDGGGSAENCLPAGANTLVNHGRCYYDSNKPYLVPIEYNWKPQIVWASDTFTNAMYTAMSDNSTYGDFGGPTYRPYLEKYNLERGLYRGINNLVQPNAQVRFIDAEKTEDWLAANSKSMLGFDLGPKGGKNLGPGQNPGYTVFVLNTWDAPAAVNHLGAQHQYHVFKIDRIDPDTGTQAGVDWARVWGGRYREVMMDLGAAPNPYESETWGNRRRAVFGSDSYDPPLWEYRANAPRVVVPADLVDGSPQVQALPVGKTWDKAALEFNIARFVDEAVSYRFLHSYLYEPRPQTGQYFLSSNIWHDQNADVPWPSDLTKLYNQDATLSGLRTLVPYLSFTGDTKFQYLSDGSDPHYAGDQAMLDQAKQSGDDVAGAPFDAMNTNVAMDYLDADKARFERGSACTTTIPDIEVVVDKHYAWDLPLIVAGVATNRDGHPWGFLASVNDLFKTAKADKPDDILAAVHPDALGGGFTYTSIHELSHFLGLAHPHDTIGKWVDPSTGKEEYWDGFTWTFDTTAAPTTYAYDELKYSILDQETIARGHTAYYLTWTDESLASGGAAFYGRGIKTLKQLPAKAQALRATALSASAQAKTLASKFDFVNAVFSAQTAFRAAAAYRDMALNQPLGTTELQKGTKGTTGQTASACPSAKS